MGQAPHLRNWVIGKGVQITSQMEECETDGDVACILLVGIQLCSRLDENGVRRIPIPELQAMIAFKNCVWLVGLRSVGYRWIVGGWIYSKPVGWLVCFCYRSIGRMDGWWLTCRLVCFLSGLSVGRSNYPAGLLSNLSPTDHPSVYLIANQSTKERSCTSDQCLHFRYRDWCSTYFRFRLTGWLRWGNLTHVCKSLVKFGTYLI